MYFSVTVTSYSNPVQIIFIDIIIFIIIIIIITTESHHYQINVL